MLSNNRPHIILTYIAVCRSIKITGIIKDDATKNLQKNVENVDSHTSLVECLFSDSSDICIPKASEIESAIAIVSIPPITTSCDWVPE